MSCIFPSIYLGFFYRALHWISVKEHPPHSCVQIEKDRYARTLPTPCLGHWLCTRITLSLVSFLGQVKSQKLQGMGDFQGKRKPPVFPFTKGPMPGEGWAEPAPHRSLCSGGKAGRVSCNSVESTPELSSGADLGAGGSPERFSGSGCQAPSRTGGRAQCENRLAINMKIGGGVDQAPGVA